VIIGSRSTAVSGFATVACPSGAAAAAARWCLGTY
jgi:hypothetical protein